MKSKVFYILGFLVLAALAVVLYAYRHNILFKPAPIVFQAETKLLNNANPEPPAPVVPTGPVTPAKKMSVNTSTVNVGLKNTVTTPATTSLVYSYVKAVCQDPNKYPGIGPQYICLTKYYQDLENNFGTVIAVGDLKQRYNEDSFVASECHPIMHTIGRAASKKYASVSEAYRYGDSYCWSGYYHGILEGVVSRIGLANLPVMLDTVCADLPGKAIYNFDYFNCVHGLGHGIMGLLDDEIFQSLKMCDNLKGWWEQQSCYSGVFMENIITNQNVADPDHHSIYLKPQEPLYPCTAVEAKYKDQCYLGQTSYALQVNSYNFNPVVELCATVEQPFRSICFQSIGRDAANQAGHNSDITKNTCAKATDANDFTNCVIGAVKEIISYYHGIKEAQGFCAILDDVNKDVCGSTADSYFKQL